jgi:hypothetical protein
MWVRGVVCRSTRTQSLTVVACVILQCILCFYECRCMSDGVFWWWQYIYGAFWQGSHLIYGQYLRCVLYTAVNICGIYIRFWPTLKFPHLKAAHRSRISEYGVCASCTTWKLNSWFKLPKAMSSHSCVRAHCVCFWCFVHDQSPKVLKF